MAQETDLQLKSEASVIKNETSAGANTASRIGNILENIIDSKPNNAVNTIPPATNTADYIPQWNGANSKTLKDGLAVPAGGLAGLTALGLKEDKVSGKGLSTNDYDATEKGNVLKGTARLDTTFVPATGVQLDRTAGTFYNLYTQSGALEVTIAAGHISSGCAILPITLDGTTITITGAVKDPKSDTASTTSTDVDRYVFWEDEQGVWYSITNLG